MVLTLWENAHESVKRLDEADVVYVGGGSTANMLALWKVHRVDRVLTRMASGSKDVVLAGISAGGACWYEGCLTDSFGDYRPWFHGLGLLKGSFCPHWDGESTRQPLYTDAIADGLLPPGWAVDNGAGIHWQDGELVGAIAERKASAWRIEPSNEPSTGGVISLPVKTQRI